jgi:hypothetical protein
MSHTQASAPSSSSGNRPGESPIAAETTTWLTSSASSNASPVTTWIAVPEF